MVVDVAGPFVTKKASAMMPSPHNEHRTRLIEVCRELQQGQRLIVAGNRGPIEYALSPEGELVPRRGHGGLVTGFGAVSQFCKITWVASAMGEADRRAAQGAEDGLVSSPLPGQNIAVRFVICPRNTYHKYYNVFSNPLLWFLQHQMWNSPYTPNIDANTYDAWQNGYVAVNRAFAEAIVAEMQREGSSRTALLQDYQLYLVGKMVRDSVPDARLLHFVHIPWPSTSSWRLLPEAMRRTIVAGLCANDIVGFQTRRSAVNFLHAAEAFLPGAVVDAQSMTVYYEGRAAYVRVYPASVDVAGLRRSATSARVREYQEKLQPLCSEQTIVRVDRIDPSRNILRGFRAYELALDRYPELRGKVKFLAFLTPSRTRVREYQRYTDELTALVGTINGKYGGEGWQPVELFLENNYLQALAALRIYDVLLVNAVVDGMNLVAKEGPVVNTRNGVLVLSEGTGAYEQLREGALAVTPTDIEGTAEALYRALRMSAEEREQRAALLRSLIEDDDITVWLYRQFADLQALTGVDSRIAPPIATQPLPLQLE